MSVRGVLGWVWEALAEPGRGRSGRSPARPIAKPRGKVPHHVAIIMDGNGRWANQRGLPRMAGHRAGVEALRGVVRVCREWGIGVLTVYAFSTENWKRPQDEIQALMELLVEYLHHELEELHKNGVRIRAVGRIGELPAHQVAAIRRAEERTSHNTGLVFNLALNYGGRSELVDAVRELVAKAARGDLRPEQVDEQMVADHLYTAGLPDPDLLIRTGGEERLSNFLLWQVAYAEIWVTPVFWPDFKPAHLARALLDYQSRERRFGGLSRVNRANAGGSAR